MPAHVFLSYVSENSDLVKKLKRTLQVEGISAWRDGDNLGAGQRWDLQIPNAIRTASSFIACFSAESEARTSTEMRREILLAIDELQTRLPGEDWFIPVKLSPCRIPDYQIGGGQLLSKIQWVELFPDWEATVRILIARLRAQPLQRNAARQEGKTTRSRPVSQNYLRRKPSDSKLAGAQSPAVHSPGGPVPSDAIPYVSRAHDKLILETLGRSHFSMLVRGPSQSGKSTALSLLERRAHEAGIETAWFDPQPAPSDPPASNASTDEAALAVSELLQARWGLQPPRRGTINTIPRLMTWLLEALEPTSSIPRLLILDDVDALGRGAAERWLSIFVRGIINQRAREGINISVAVSLTNHFGVAFPRKLTSISSAIHWQPMVILGWFDQEDIVKLWHLLRDTQATDLIDDSALGTIFVMFKGQPYLTHAALIDKAFRDLVLEWHNNRAITAARAIRKFQWYRRHRAAIRLAMLGSSLEPDSAARALIRSLSEACSSRSSVLDPDHDFLMGAKLIEEDGRLTLDIYRLVAEDLAAEIGLRATL